MSGNLLPTYRRQFKPIQPLRPLAPLPKLGQSPSLMGQRTMPIAGAPLLPANPFLRTMRIMQRYRK